MKCACIIVIIVIVLVSVSGIVWYEYQRQKGFLVKESFGMLPSRTWKVERVFADPYSSSSCGCGDSGPDFFQTPHFQGILSPRFSNTDYGPYIRTELPPYQAMGVPADPLGGDVGGSFDAAQSGCVEGVVGTFMDANGELKQPIVYDRFMYANRNSRLRSAGDPIRGDLPIVPASGNWFTPSVHPNIDLQAGALNVLGGVNNETSNRLNDLIYSSSGGGDTTIGGVDLRQQTSMMTDCCYDNANMMMGNNNYVGVCNGGGDVIVQSYPM